MNNLSAVIKRAAKAAVSAALCTALISASCFASTLGSSKINGYTVQIGTGTYYTHNTFFSDQSGVGKQTENYITYTANSDVFPSITNGSALYGTQTLSKETSRLEGIGTNVLGGTNADYFSFKTGVPMSNAIVDGKILTKDASGQDGIGILPDGTAFISYFTLASVMIKADGSETNIYNINKYRQPYAAYLMTRDFSTTTHNTTKGYDVILGQAEGEMKLGTRMTAVVESISENSSSIEIPEGKMVLTIDSNAPAEFLDPIKSLTAGEKITLSFGVIGDSRWKDVQVGMGSVGGRLLINGEVNSSLAAGAAPRTAIGIKEDGSIVLYTIDGRQNGYSYGVQLKTLAKRMKELGCTDAINLDGGGSTAITVKHPGNDKSEIVNKPSEGKERSVSTCFYFINHAKQTGVAEHLHFYPIDNYVLKGASLNLSLKATDSGFFPAALPENIVYSVEDGKTSTISPSGVFTANEGGTVGVYAESENAKGSISITCLETPTDIKVKNAGNGEYLTSVRLKKGESVNLTADAYGGYNKLTAQTESFSWSADEAVGTIGADGKFTATLIAGTTGNIYVKAGQKTVTIPVTITGDNTSDPKSYPYIDLEASDTAIAGKISCENGFKTEKEKISIKIDGKQADFEYNSENGEFTLPLPAGSRKISVYATNILGNTNVAYLNLPNAAENENPFSDTADHWAKDVLSFMYNKGIVSGENVNNQLRFNPQKQMTRSEFAVMMCNYLGINPDSYASVTLPYADLSSIPSWALGSFKALYQLNILKGSSSGGKPYANPYSAISREEAAVIISRIVPSGLYKAEITAPDKDSIAVWAYEGIQTLYKLGAISGYEDGRILPQKALTKAEAAKILYYVM